jgi:hypothetical protein
MVRGAIMNIFDVMKDLNQDNMLKGTAKDGYALSKQYIRWFDGNITYCEEDGYPKGHFNFNEFFLMYDWELVELPEYTSVTFEKAKQWLLNGGVIKLVYNDLSVVFQYKDKEFHSSIPGRELSWEEIIVGEWYIKNERQV